MAQPDLGAADHAAVSPLPDTAKEAAGVLPYLQRLGKVEPTVFVGTTARESVAKAARRPKVALFNTHGFASVVPGQHPMALAALRFAERIPQYEATAMES